MKRIHRPRGWTLHFKSFLYSVIRIFLVLGIVGHGWVTLKVEIMFKNPNKHFASSVSCHRAEKSFACVSLMVHVFEATSW